MQAYYTMKLKCVMYRLAVGSAFIIVGLCIAASIVQEMLGSYLASSKNAYAAGLVISAAMVIGGFFMMAMALNFEKYVFAGRGSDFAVLRQDMDTAQPVTGKDLLITGHFLISFDLKARNACSVVKTRDVVACFEDAVWEADDDLKKCSLTIFDKKFRKYEIELNGENAETGHDLKLRLCSLMPWIFSASKDDFLDSSSTREGRSRLAEELKKRKSDAMAEKDSGGSVLLLPDNSSDIDS